MSQPKARATDRDAGACFPVEFVVRDGLHLAYRRPGHPYPALVFVGGSMAMSVQWEEPATAKSLRHGWPASPISSPTTSRGMGYSDRMDLSLPPTIEDLVADLEAVIRGGRRGPSLSSLGRTTAVRSRPCMRREHPVRQLVLCNTWARLEAADDSPDRAQQVGFWTVWAER